MGLLREPVATRSHSSWKNLATRYGRFCVQKRTEEGLSKNTKLRHRWFYVAEDLFPFRIIYSTHPSDFTDAPSAASPVNLSSPTYPRVSAIPENGRGVNSNDGTSSTPAEVKEDGVIMSLVHWLTGSDSDAAAKQTSPPPSGTAAAAPTTNFFFFSPFSSPEDSMERFTVATSTQLSGILEAWGMLLPSWEPEEAELNVLSFASPAMGSPTARNTSSSSTSVAVAAAAAASARVPFYERWRRTYGRIEVLRVESGMEPGSFLSSASYDEGSTTPPSPSLNDSGMNFKLYDVSPPQSTLPLSRSRRVDVMASSTRTAMGEDGSLDHVAAASSRSFASRRHVHISDAYYAADGATPIAMAHFFDVLLIRVVDLLMWRDPQLTACCLGILVSVYGYSAWASALCYLAGETLSSSSEYCSALYARGSATNGGGGGGGGVVGERLWWGAPLFMVGVLAYPWTREQRRRVVTPTDREHLRSIDYALRWLCATDGDDDAVAAATTSTATKEASRNDDASGAAGGGSLGVLLDVARRVCAVLHGYRLPISLLLLFNVIGAFSTWEAILVLFLWPMLIVSVGLAGVVVVTQCLTNK